MPRDAFIVPLKSFAVAKERLRSAGASDVTAFAEELALGVIGGCRPREVVIVGETHDVAAFAHRHGVEFLQSPTAGLNEAVQFAFEQLRGRYSRVVVVHGDLRSPTGLSTFEPPDGVTVVTDRHGRGTNVLAVPTSIDFRFAYGPDSAARHIGEARRLGVSSTVIDNSPWGLDIDDPDDLTIDPHSI